MALEHRLDAIPQGEAVSEEPIDVLLLIHIWTMILAFGIAFPIGLVLSFVRSRWRLPIRALYTVLAAIGLLLGPAQKGRQFPPNVHATSAIWLMEMFISDIAVDMYLGLHLNRGIHSKIRGPIGRLRDILGIVILGAAWVQILFGSTTILGFCTPDYLGQCLRHFIVGSAFIGYGVILTILLLVGQLWLRRTGRSQEFFESLVIATCGCVNFFAESRRSGAWVSNNLLHPSIWMFWWIAGLLGIWLSRTRDGGPKRNVIPGVVMILTGLAISSHPQSLPVSTMVHTAAGYTLMAAGIARIIEISVILRDRNATTEDGSDPHSFQYLTPFLLYASGFLFIGATEEQMALLSAYNFPHVSYIIFLYSIAFLLFLFVNMLLYLYAVHTWPAKGRNRDLEAQRRKEHIGAGEAGEISEFKYLLSEEEKNEDKAPRKEIN